MLQKGLEKILELCLHALAATVHTWGCLDLEMGGGLTMNSCVDQKELIYIWKRCLKHLKFYTI